MKAEVHAYNSDNNSRWPQVNRLTFTVTQSQVVKQAQNEAIIHYVNMKNYSGLIFIDRRLVMHDSDVVYRVESEKIVYPFVLLKLLNYSWINEKINEL